jgi:hypothetical protein
MNKLHLTFLVVRVMTWYQVLGIRFMRLEERNKKLHCSNVRQLL